MKIEPKSAALFTHACIRRPGPEMVRGLFMEFHGTPDFETALLQHRGYEKALTTAGLQITVYPADPRFPDGCFVEDTHLILPEAVVRLYPGAPSRRQEFEGIRACLPVDRPHWVVPADY